jgi:hypothetical protein
MGPDTKTIQHVATQVLRAWRGALPFFLSIELWLVVLVAFAIVGGMFLAVLGDLRCLLPFGFAGAYLVVRPMLHVKRILAWPFI